MNVSETATHPSIPKNAEIDVMLNAAHKYTSNGYSVIPVDKNKRAALNSWSRYQHDKPSELEISRWFAKDPSWGMAVVAGRVSGNLLTIDVDCKYDLTGSLMDDFRELIEEHLPELAKKMVVAGTTNKGFHVLVRVPAEEMQGNKKLASRPATAEEAATGEKVKVLIETRGEGGYFVVEPSPGYQFIQGDLATVPLITAQECEILLSIARSFDQMPIQPEPLEKAEQKKRQSNYSGMSPFDDYNARADIPALLQKHGYNFVYEHKERMHFKRPGNSDSKVSCNYHTLFKTLYVFSTSTEFESSRGYNPTQVYTILEHGGDYSAASRALYAEGYGARKIENTKAELRIEAQAEGNDPLRIIYLKNVEPENISWLWFPYIAKRKLTLISGEEGLGKSWLTCAFAASVSTGSGFPVNFEKTTPGNVLMLSAEDGLADTIKPRLMVSGADTSRVFAPDEPLSFDEKGLQRLEMYIAETAPMLVTVDPLFAYTPGKVDVNSANQSRTISARLAAIAEKFDCSIILVRHIGKSKGFGDARAAGLGSIDWRAAVRSELLVGKNPDNDQERAIVHTKSNLAAFGDSIGFLIQGAADGATLLWTGKSHLTAACILSNVKDDDTRAAQSEAADFLRDALSDGEKEAQEVKREASRLGLSEQQLRTARGKLGVKPYNMGFGKDKKWFWKLPDVPLDVDLDVYKNEQQHLKQNRSNKTSCSNDLPIDVAAKNNQQLKQQLSNERETVVI